MSSAEQKKEELRKLLSSEEVDTLVQAIAMRVLCRTRDLLEAEVVLIESMREALKGSSIKEDLATLLMLVVHRRMLHILHRCGFDIFKKEAIKNG